MLGLFNYENNGVIRIGYSRKGFSLIEVIIVAAIIGIVCAIALPNFNRMRVNTYHDKCVANLKRIVSAKELWSLETGAADTDTPTAAQLDIYIKDDIWDEDNNVLTSGHALICSRDSSADPTLDTSYNINNIKTPPSCKIDGTHILP